MADKPITFTEQEQLQLNELEKSNQELSNYKIVVLKGSFPGEHSPVVFQLVNFFESLLKQVSQRANEIKEGAAKRQSDAEAAASAPATSVEQ